MRLLAQAPLLQGASHGPEMCFTAAQVFNLKFTSKQLNKASKKAEKDEKVLKSYMIAV